MERGLAVPEKIRTVKIKPGAHFLIRGFAKIDNREWVPVEIDLGESLSMPGHSVCAAVVKQAVGKQVAEAFVNGNWRVLQRGAPEREGAPPIITNGGG